MSTNPTMKLSGLQKEVLALYRHCLRESRKKAGVRDLELLILVLISLLTWKIGIMNRMAVTISKYLLGEFV